ncbi:hypothetical protein [Ferrovibrio sp.]|uniref:hypothetical protein n=1 Tax=Ferrovibrio sp. TaxID=1917215 RepID=UPI00311E83BC
MTPAGRTVILALLLHAALPAAALAQQQPPPAAAARKDACFRPKEVEAEAQVRTGIQLREILRRCAEIYPDGQKALQDWYAFDNENAEQLRAAVDQRRQALNRIYPTRTRVTQWETDSAVATMKSVQVNDGVCQSTYDVIDRLKKEKWKAFVYYSGLQQKLLAYEIPICR